MISPAKTFSYAMGHLKKGEASIDRVFEIIDYPIQDQSHLKHINSFEDKVEFKNVSFAYEGKLFKGCFF